MRKPDVYQQPYYNFIAQDYEVRTGKGTKIFPTLQEAQEFCDYWNSRKKHRWENSKNDYLHKVWKCADCGITKEARLKDGNHLINYTLDGIIYDTSPGCKFKEHEI